MRRKNDSLWAATQRAPRRCAAPQRSSRGRARRGAGSAAPLRDAAAPSRSAPRACRLSPTAGSLGGHRLFRVPGRLGSRELAARRARKRSSLLSKFEYTAPLVSAGLLGDVGERRGDEPVAQEEAARGAQQLAAGARLALLAGQSTLARGHSRRVCRGTPVACDPVGLLIPSVSMRRTPRRPPSRSRRSASTATSSSRTRSRRRTSTSSRATSTSSSSQKEKLAFDWAWDENEEQGAALVPDRAVVARRWCGPRSTTRAFRKWAVEFGSALLGKHVEFWYDQFLGKPPDNERADLLAPGRGLLGPQPRRQGHHLLDPAAGRRRDATAACTSSTAATATACSSTSSSRA